MYRGSGVVAAFVLLPTLHAQFKLEDLGHLREYESQRSSSFDRSGGNHDCSSIQPGQTLTIFDESGPGEIRHIWTTMPPWSEPYHLKKVVLRMYWDDEKEPSVEAPIGDFFGLGLGTYTNYESALTSVRPEQALNAYFPMPFRKHGRVTVTNEGSKEIGDYYWNIDWIRLETLPEDAAYLHAQYRQCAPCKGWYRGSFYDKELPDARQDPRWKNVTGEGNYVILDAKGNGQFVGMTISLLLNQWGGWNEGDEMIWIDNEPMPRIHGTGGEDYFNGAWGLKKLFSTPLVGMTRMDGWEQGSRYSLYRWHLEAPVRFRQAIRVSMEDGHANLRSDNIYSVAYWYQKEPHASLRPLPKVDDRIPRVVSAGDMK